MFSQDRKYFRFRFNRVLVLAFLLISLTQFTQGTGVPASCGKASTADPKLFAMNFVGCVSELTTEENWKIAGELIQKLPKLMEKALSVVKKEGSGGLAFLSAYFLYSSYELHGRAMNLAWDYKMRRHEFKSLEQKMIPVRNFMEKELIPEWKKGSYAKTQKNAEKLFQMLTRSSTELQQLVQVILQDGKKGASHQSSSVVYGVGAVAVCAGSVFVCNIPVMVVTCVGSVGTIYFSVNSYYTLGDTLIKLDTLWEDTTKMREETFKYRAQLDIAKIRGEFEM